MDDSFLEDLGYTANDQNAATSSTGTSQVDRHVTKRHASSTPLNYVPKKHMLEHKSKSLSVSPVLSSNEQNPKISKKLNIKESRKSTSDKKKINPNLVTERESKQPLLRTKSVDETNKPPKNKLKPLLENKYKSIDIINERESNINVLTSNEKRKSLENKDVMDQHRHYINSKDIDPSNILNKENQLVTVSKETNLQPRVTKERKTDSSSRRSGSIEMDGVGLLSAIKELIIKYSERESTKVLKAMQDLHINSQSNLIKQFIHQSQVWEESQMATDTNIRQQNLLQENEKLRETVISLQIQLQHLQKKIEELETVKHENEYFKLKLKDAKL